MKTLFQKNDYEESQNDIDVEHEVMWACSGDSFLFVGRFEFLGLGELVHAVVQIGAIYGLLLNHLIKV
jgi:hypothetical protein